MINIFNPVILIPVIINVIIIYIIYKLTSEVVFDARSDKRME